MLTKEDLQGIQKIVETESCRQMNIIVEGAILPQLQALAEGQKLLLETLAPRGDAGGGSGAFEKRAPHPQQ